MFAIAIRAQLKFAQCNYVNMFRKVKKFYNGKNIASHDNIELKDSQSVCINKKEINKIKKFL